MNLARPKSVIFGPKSEIRVTPQKLRAWTSRVFLSTTVAPRPNDEHRFLRLDHRATVQVRRRGGNVPDRGFSGLLADLIRQPRDLTQAANPILKIGPEVDAQSAARLLQ